jgi:ABC-2 type transport system ATP-binding protein
VSRTVIETAALRKRYGRHEALSGIDLTVGAGEVFGLIGPNGAGKTTLIRILVDLIRPTSGAVRVLGGDPRRDGVAIRRRIGHLPGDLALYDRLTPREHLTLLARIRGLANLRFTPFAERLHLELDRPIRTLSKGNRQKVGLVQAFMHEPDLLILDEPTSGLDPIVQHEFGLLLAEARDRGATVFLSSHVLSEVERVADRVGLVREGRLVVVDDVGHLKSRVARRLDLYFAQPPPQDAFRGLPGVRSVDQQGEHVTLVLEGNADAAIKRAARFEVTTLASREPDLEDIFLELVEAQDAA